MCHAPAREDCVWHQPSPTGYGLIGRRNYNKDLFYKENVMVTKKETNKEEVPELKISFEKALEKLEHIVDEMESGRMSLEDMITRFEEGQKLIKFCGAKLNEVERKIEILVKKNGKTEAEPFDDSIVEDGKDEPF